MLKKLIFSSFPPFSRATTNSSFFHLKQTYFVFSQCHHELFLKISVIMAGNLGIPIQVKKYFSKTSQFVAFPQNLSVNVPIFPRCMDKLRGFCKKIERVTNYEVTVNFLTKILEI